MSEPAFSPAVLERALARLVPGWPRARLLVAFSGGADSVALLAALAELPRRGLEIRALHVDHGLHPASRRWAQAARRIARQLRVPLRVRRTRVEARRGESLEARARAARYGLLAAAMRPGELLVTAHHEDDQAETLLLQLLRGAGVAGLAAMPQAMPFARGSLLRPLLGTSRAALRHWAQARALEWVEDESNADPRFDRNFLRRRVLPPLVERWPQAPRVIARAAAHLGEARGLLAELADLDLQAVAEADTLEVARLLVLSLPRRRNLVRRWLEHRGLPLPDRNRLERIVGEACAARRDALPTIAWGGAEVRRWRGRLYCMRTLGPAPQPLPWRRRAPGGLELPGGLGRLCLVADARGPFSLARLPGVLRVSFRAGGERLRPRAAGPTRALKELLRSGDVLPWMRDRVPLVHARGRLLAVADLWSNADAEALAGARSRRRVRIEWRDSPPVKMFPARAPRSARHRRSSFD